MIANPNTFETFNGEYPTIECGRLCIRRTTGGIYPIGVRQARKDISQIEASERNLAESTKARLACLKKGIEMWDRRK